MKILRGPDSRKSLLVSLTLAGLIGLYRASAQAASTAINCLGNLDFGTIMPAAGAGTVIIQPGGSRTTTGGVSVVGGAVIIPSCVVTGSFDTSQVSVTTPTVILNSGGDTMVLSDFNVEIDNGGPAYTGTEISDIQIGATLNVGASQASGSYSGTFTVMLTVF